MNAPFRKPCKLAGIAISVAGALGFGAPVESGTLTIATEPLGTALTAIKPNVMFILDDSGSMYREYMPEYVVAPSSNSVVGVLIPGTPACFDSGDNWDGETNASISGSLDPCWPGDPPYMSPDFNTIYYNPAIQYRPAINFDGTLKPSQDRSYTSTWTAVRTDEYNVENWHQRVDADRDAIIAAAEQTSASATNVNLATGYPDRVWCTSTSEVMTGATCRQNSAYLYPDHDFPYGMTGGAGDGNPRYTTGAPYYYRMQTTQYCRPDGTDCRHGQNITVGTHTREEVEYCVDTELTNCAAGNAKTAAHVHTGVRWCNNTDLREDPVTDNPRVRYCQRKKIGTFIHAKHLGKVVSVSATVGARPAEGNIFVSAVAAGGGTITSIVINGVTIASNIAIGSGSTTTQAATSIAAGIDAHADYLATAFGANAAVTAAINGSALNGQAITVTSSSTVTAGGKATLTLSAVTGTASKLITSITLGGTQLLCNAAAGATFGSSVAVTAGGRTITAGTGWDTSTKISDVMEAVTARINACQAGSGFSAVQIAGAGAKVEIRASTGISSDGMTISVTASASGGSFSGTALAGTVRTPDIRVNTTNMAGGANGSSGTRSVRIGVGKFTRTDIIPNIPTYPKVSTRADCVSSSSTCTWEEEMTNFANWYTYYRSRLKMMKTAAGRAFASVPESYRVGFITINPMSATTGGSVNTSTKYLKIAPFDDAPGAHKSTFFSRLYNQTAGNFTPLREALSRVGQIYAGKVGASATGLTNGLTAADDPMTTSCQPNFAILSTDGYWNKASTSVGDIPRDINNTQIGNQDNVDSGYSTRAAGAYDGNLLSSTFANDSTQGGSGTLADVAMYYYKTDLRTTGSFATNNVPVTNKDTNPAQHMVTFTLGLGLDGELTYRSDYETALTGDFAAIKAGTKNWPAPQGDTPSALDDLWHAAVNGRGVFFSAKDPDTLSEALTDTLNALTTRIGAGAAAATSNLQPVAGDNFAFTAQYQTGTWVGDLKARTIDLTSGIVSAVTLWSAASLLDLMDHTDRNIYTFGGGTGNQLKKHFCLAPDFGAPWCSDGGVNNGLSVAELAYFDPTQLDQHSDYTAGQLSTVHANKVVHFIRGERTYENTASALDTDLFRPRENLLGDIINAQPSYVKKSPFLYGDAGYDAFKQCTTGGTPAPAGCPVAQFPDTSKPRLGSVFAAANDGMLHAFETDVNNNPYFQTAGIGTDLTADDTFSCDPAVCNVGNGVERWAYIPGLVLPNLHKLADQPYVHRYYTDGSPTVGDVCISSTCLLPSPTAGASDWRTILVAGLNGGGIGYYALDITNPSPSGMKVLWEFTHRGTCWTDAQIAVLDKTDDCHLGFSYGNPIITKRKSDGKWVVIVSSGYNNTVGTAPNQGDGKGYIYILEADTGKILNRISTGVGTTASPSGLAKINGFSVAAITDNTVLGVYGGDLDGNMWRIGLETTTPVVVKLATTKEITTGLPQPITVKPELGKVEANPDIRVVMFGTGKFLEETDKANAQRQTIYALRDDPADDSGPIIADVRVGSAITVRTFTPYLPTDATRTVTAGTAPTWTGTSYGWLIDLPETRERVNVDPQLQLGTLIVSSNVPSTDTCSAGGSSWLNFLDYATGSYVPGATGNMAGQRFASSLAVGINVVMLPGGRVVTIVTTADNQQMTQNTPVPAGGFGGRRVSWRELIRE